MSRAAAGLVKALLAAADDPAHRILLTEIRSVDWQSLTFVGERHELTLRLIGPDAFRLAERLVRLLPDREWCIAGHIVADIAARLAAKDEIGSVSVAIEALTITEN